MAEPNKYTSDQLEKALRKADAAGDAEAAREIAKALREQSAIENVDQYAKPMPFADAISVQSKQGFDWGLTDESKGVQAAMGLPEWSDRAMRMATPGVPVANIALGVGGLAAEATGRTPKAYTEARDAERADVSQAWTDRPVTSFGAQAASAAAYPGGAMKAGAPIMKESLKMALLGVLQGGAYGYTASEGETADRMQGAEMGAVLGGVLGGALPGGTAMVTPAIRAAKGSLAKGVDAIGGVFGKDVGAQAGHAQQVAKAAVERSMNRSGMTPEKIMEAIDKFGDKPAVLAEVIGQDAVNALTALTRAPGSTAQKAQDIITDRFGGFPARAADDLRTATGLTDKQIAGDFTEEIANRQKAAAPVYKGAFDAFPEIADPRLEQLKAAPVLKKAMSKAKTRLENEAAAAGKKPEELSQLQFWDLVKRELDSVESAALAKPNGSGAEDARMVEIIRDPVLKTLDRLTGGQYANARDLGGEAPRLRTAFNQGSKALRPSTTRATVANQAASLKPQDRNAFAAGTASVIDEELARSVPPNKYRLPATQEKVTAAFGDEGGNAFIKNMSAEAELRDLGSRWGPRMSSVTGVVGEHGSNSGADVGLRAAFALAKGNLKELALIASGVMRRRGFSEAERNAMGDLLLSNPQEGLKRLGIQLPTPSAPAAPVASSIAPPQQSPQPANALAPQQPMKSSGTATFGNDLANAAVGGTVGGMGGSFSGEFIDYNKDGKIDETDKQIGFLIGTGVGAFGAPAGTRIGVKGHRFDMKGSGPSGMKPPRMPKLKPDVPKGRPPKGGNPKLGQGNLIRQQYEGENPPRLPEGPMTDAQIKARKAREAAMPLIEQGLSGEAIRQQTGVQTLTYKGKTIVLPPYLNGVNNEAIHRFFYDSLKQPFEKRPKWVQNALRQMAGSEEDALRQQSLWDQKNPLQLGGQRTPMVQKGKPQNAFARPK